MTANAASRVARVAVAAVMEEARNDMMNKINELQCLDQMPPRREVQVCYRGEEFQVTVASITEEVTLKLDCLLKGMAVSQEAMIALIVLVAMIVVPMVVLVVVVVVMILAVVCLKVVVVVVVVM